MKKLKKPLSLILCLMMLFGLSSTAFAAEDKNQWDKKWENNTPAFDAAVTLFPGNDENDRTIAWYSKDNKGTVEIITPDGKEIIEADAKKTDDGDYRLFVTLEDLAEGTYKYKCISDGFTSESCSFTIKSSDSFTAMYVSDIHISKGEGENEVRDTAYLWNNAVAAAKEKAQAEGGSLDLIVSGGDQASEGLYEEFKGLSATPFTKEIPFAVSIGNHDRKSTGYKGYTVHPNEADIICKSYIGTDYWFRQGDALFLILDSCNCSMRGHYKFMKQATEQNEDASWIIAVMHHDLFGGREPWLNTENKLLKLLWTPFFDEFGVDLCLYGHSHYYSVSNVIYNRKTVEKVEHNSALTDPEGTVYLSSGSITRFAPLLDDDGNVPPVGENAGYVWLQEKTVYNLLDFTESTLTVKSVTAEDNEEFNRLTITKSSAKGGHSFKNPAPYLKPIAFFAGRIVNIINNIDMYNRYKDQGYDVSVKEGLIGS